MSGHSYFDTDSQIYTLISTLKYLIVYLTLLLGCLTNISNTVCAKQNLAALFSHPAHPWVFLFSVDGTTINPVAQAQTLGVMLIPLSPISISNGSASPVGFLFSMYMPIHLLLLVFYSTICSLEDYYSLLWSLCFHFYFSIMHSWSNSFRNGGHILWLTGFKPPNSFSSLGIKLRSLSRLIGHLMT